MYPISEIKVHHDLMH